jgi:hypothetical protein
VGALPTTSAPATAVPSPTPLPPPATALPPTPSSEDGWLIHSREAFDRPSTWPAKQATGWASGYTDGRYWLKLSGQRTISYRVPLDSAEFRTSVDVQVSGGSAGLLFLIADDGWYRFLIDERGRYRLERQQDGAATALKDWTAAKALRAGADAINTIEVRLIEHELLLYANDVSLGTFPLPAGAQPQSQVGMTLDAVARDSVALAYFDNLVVRVPAVPAAP